MQITRPAPHHSIFTDRILFLTSNQQCQNTVCVSYDVIVLKEMTGQMELVFGTEATSYQVNSALHPSGVA